MSPRDGRLLLYAPNVHTGGGVVLLKALLADWPDGVTMFAWLDSRARAKITLPADAQVTWVNPSVSSRIRAEITLARSAQDCDRILCFHGLPPILPNRARSLIFQQNRNYLGAVPLTSFSWRSRQRLRFEQAIAYILRHRCSAYWVQTPSMARDLQKWYGKKTAKINVLPFLQDNAPRPLSKSIEWDFIYVADGEAHKNHRRLLEAWILLANEAVRPTLALTLSDRDAALENWVEQCVSTHKLLVTNLGHLTHEKLLDCYSKSKALIFPSISESFGLPLIEARQLGLDIIASELDFVRDVCRPSESFDPYSSVSIARAVKRFLGNPDPLVQPVKADEFLRAISNDRPSFLIH